MEARPAMRGGCARQEVADLEAETIEDDFVLTVTTTKDRVLQRDSLFDVLAGSVSRAMADWFLLQPRLHAPVSLTDHSDAGVNGRFEHGNRGHGAGYLLCFGAHPA